MWTRLSDKLFASRLLNALFAVCFFIVCDVIIGLTYDPTALAPEELISDSIIAVVVSLFNFELYKVMKSLRKTDQQKQA